MAPTVGIDLGTTNSLVAVMQDQGPVLIPNALRQVLTPSVVGRDDSGQMVVGQTARELRVTQPDRCASVFKRQMGSSWTTELGDRDFSAVELSSFVLRSLKADAEAFLKETVHKAVITVPAYFNEEQRRSTIAAGRLAGLEVERILNEPTAAAIAYGLHAANEEKIAVVVDLGGGTFDVSIVEMFEGTLEIRASAGEIFLGGEDFTNACVSHLLRLHGMAYERVEMEEPLRLARLYRECERAKRLLTTEMQAQVRLPTRSGEFDEKPSVVTITREDFEGWTKPILNRILMPIRRALGDAQLKRDDADEIILVGGATRMPCLAGQIEDLFGKAPRCSLNPDEVVALGAAIHGGLLDRHETLTDLVVTDVAPFTMGVEISRDVGTETRDGYFLPIINRNTTIPVSRINRVCTREPNQTHITVAVYQGESRMVKENLLLGKFDVSGIPRGPAGQEVDIRFTYDLNGVLEVEATIVETRKKATHIFTRHAKGLNQKQIQKAVEEMQALKIHPRDETTNRYLLRRAERLYAELPLRERRILDHLLHGFESVLEIRDQAAMEKYREELHEFLKSYDAESEEEGDANDF